MRSERGERVVVVQDITVWCSNDYLGMSAHPAVTDAVHQAIKNHGVGAGGTRNISGNSVLHEDLENERRRRDGEIDINVPMSQYKP